MPRLTNSRIVAQLQRNTESLFYDGTAYLIVETPTGAYDDYNNAVTTTGETEFECSFTDKVSKEKWKDYADIQEVDAEIRFSDVTPSKGDTIRLDGMYDSLDMTDKTYEIVGIRDRDVFGYLCALKAVTV